MIFNVDGLKFLSYCRRYATIFLDPPDSIGLKYNKYEDDMPLPKYHIWLARILKAAISKADVVWLSYNAKYIASLNRGVAYLLDGNPGWTARTFIWHFTFGQHRSKDCGNDYRPILRLSSPEWKPNVEDIRVPSARQLKYKDKRANPKGRVPGDVWQFPRVCGTFHERRPWHPTQHPEALMERILRMSGGPVLDLFLGSGTTLRVAKSLEIECDGCEIDPEYCRHISEETGEKLMLKFDKCWNCFDTHNDLVCKLLANIYS